jgi:hypothetical protein
MFPEPRQGRQDPASRIVVQSSGVSKSSGSTGMPVTPQQLQELVAKGFLSPLRGSLGWGDLYPGLAARANSVRPWRGWVSGASERAADEREWE